MIDKPKRQRKKQPSEKKRLPEQQLTSLGEIFPGFAPWYRSHYDENGNLLPSARIPPKNAAGENSDN